MVIVKWVVSKNDRCLNFLAYNSTKNQENQRWKEFLMGGCPQDVSQQIREAGIIGQKCQALGI